MKKMNFYSKNKINEFIIFILKFIKSISFANVLSFLIYFLYFLSLERCLKGEEECTFKQNWIFRKVIEELLSCILASILILLIILKKISWFHILHFILFFFIMHKYSHGIYFYDHGAYNFNYFFVVLLILLFIYFFFMIVFHLIKKYRYTSIVFLIIFLKSIFYINNKYINCSGWDKGLNNSYIDNDANKYGCQIQIPKICPYKIGKYFLDRINLYRVNCKEMNGFKNKLMTKSKSRYINSNTSKIGYPLVNKDNSCFVDRNSTMVWLFDYFHHNLIDVENKELNSSLRNKYPEIIIDFKNENDGMLSINVKFNETLSKERKKMEKNLNPFSNNILVLYFDSTSRALSIRQLKKTLSFIEKFMGYKGNFYDKEKSGNFHSFQFFKYHSFLGYTPANYPILFYGDKRDKNNIFITKYLKENGYITSYTSDLCSQEIIRTFHTFSEKDIYDHEFLICDHNLVKKYDLRCLYRKMQEEYMYKYSEQFWKIYKNNRKYTLITSQIAHEGTLEMLKYADDIVYNFLNELFSHNLLKDTTLFLLSDHGSGMPSVYYLNNFHKYELHLPMLYILVNDRNNTSYNEQYLNIYTNQQTFITGYDIYNTFINLIYGDDYKKFSPKSKKGESLFDKIEQKKRNPTLYENMVKTICK